MMNNELSLKDIQEAELGVLKYIDEVCKKLGIEYCLAYGTLLGAIRHNGFIPWDDDLDIWMKRRDFNVFRDYFLNNDMVSNPFSICCRYNNENYQYYIPRICDKRYEYYSESRKKIIDGMGVFVDVYPVDSYGVSIKKGKQLERKIRKINSLYAVYLDKESYSGNTIKAIAKKILNKLLRNIKGDDYHLKVDRLIEKKIDKYTSDNDIYVGTPTWEVYHSHYPRELFGEYVLHRFCDCEFPIPAQYDEILRLTYGDYMTLPPKRKRHPSHCYKIYKKTDM